MPEALAHTALGAQLLQATLHTADGTPVNLLYLSPLPAPRIPGAPVRGGVPVPFPQFADIGPLPKHGMVRTTQWQPDGADAYTLQIAAIDYPAWPHACVLRLSVQTGPAELVITLEVRNTGNSTFTWTGGLHPYFAVDDLTHCSVTGLEGLQLQDRYNPAAARQTGNLSWTAAPCERLYAQAPELQLHAGSHSVHLRASGFTQWMVWNPGTATAQTMADLPDDDWKWFVCLEPVCVDQPVVLAPGEVFEGVLQVRVANEQFS